MNRRPWSDTIFPKSNFYRYSASIFKKFVHKFSKSPILLAFDNFDFDKNPH